MRHVLLITTLLASSGRFIAGQDVTTQMNPKHRDTLQQWLAKRPGLRLADEVDCGDCQGDLARIRAESGGKWKPNPSYQPYYLTGDFNGDGAGDFAVALINESSQTRRFAVAIFNGPFAVRKGPAYYRDDFDLRGGGLFYGPPRPKPYRLIAGRFETHSAVLFEPQGRTYVEK